MDIAYFDNAATTFPKPNEVYDFMDKFYREYGVNVGRGQYKLASRAADLVQETRSLLLELFHCPEKKVIFTPSATEALNVILMGLDIPNNANVYITPFEHNAVTRVLHHIAQTKEINIIELAVDKKSFQYNLETIAAQFFEKKPYLVVMAHASNVCGLITPVLEIAFAAKKHDALTVIDMAQTAGLIDIDLSTSNIDYAVFAGHKTLYGPFGIAGIVVKKEAALKPLLYGGTGIESANQDLPITIPEKFEVGSMNIQAIAGLHAALKWINRIGITEIRAVESQKHKMLIDLLRGSDQIRILGQKDLHNSIGVVSCTFDNYSSDEIGRILDRTNVAVRSGLHCAPTAHKFMGSFPGGTVRFSVSYFTNSHSFNLLSSVITKINNM